jgi:hypothetical protein
MVMAKRSYSKKGRNIEPSVQTVFLSSSTVAPGATGSFTADLSQIASLINRRFYRQGINWAVAGIKILTQGQGSITVKKLPNTWVLSNAWMKGFKAWQKMNNEALAEAESVRPKFLDFKIYADSTHHADGFGANLLPLDGSLPVAQPYVAGEWFASKYVIPVAAGTTEGAVQEREIVATGTNYPGTGASGLNAISLIEGYAASRGLRYPEDPNVPNDAADAENNTPENWMSALFNDGTQQTDEVLDTMVTENNQAPYPFEGDGTAIDTQYPGGANQAPGLQVHDFEFITATTIGGTTRMKGGNFPCGLMRFDWAVDASSITSNIAIQIDLIPGNHRGYLCEPMSEM